jgi:hypothetical protein
VPVGKKKRHITGLQGIQAEVPRGLSDFYELGSIDRGIMIHDYDLVRVLPAWRA